MNSKKQNRKFGVAIAAMALVLSVVIALLWGHVFVNKGPLPLEHSASVYHVAHERK